MTSPKNFYSVANMIVPKEGPKVVPVELDFSGTESIEIDGNEIVTTGAIDYIQTVFVDNSENESSLSIRSSITGQVIVCPPLSQGNFNLFVPNMPKFTLTTEGALIMRVYFCNFPLIPAVWSATGEAVPEPEPAYDINEYSLELTGDNEVAIPAGEATMWYTIYNPIGNADITFSPAGSNTDNGGIVLTAGERFTMENGGDNQVTIKGTALDIVFIYSRRLTP